MRVWSRTDVLCPRFTFRRRLSARDEKSPPWRRFRGGFLVCFLILANFTPASAQLPSGEDFTFVRIRWTDNNIRYGYGFSTNAPPWAHDFPQAEKNLNLTIQALTNIKVSEDNKVLTFDDDEIFRYPFIYACEIGYLTLSDLEVQNLREYLLRGGFLMVDDFRWRHEWNNWMREIRKVLPDQELRRLDVSHPIFHCFFDINDINAPTPYLNELPEYWGLFDDTGRLMVLINFNNDVGDGWELPKETPAFSTRSYKLGINYLIYALTH
ncbi:MAG: DUF4159 domain-containing protein [Caldithrix sp.]|nr:MAG: DUF4159 domain-containing protein [Caldithrix sp.]